MFALLILTFSPALANTELNGFIKSDMRLLVSENDLPFFDIYNTLRLELYARPSDSVSTFGSLDLRYHYFSMAESLSDLSEREKIGPLDIGVWEAYVDLYGFVLSALDLRIGRQRIAWGTADRLNPTDNLNPDDFSDPLDFGKKRPTMAINGMYYLGNYTIALVWLPVFRPALFPQTGFTLAQGIPSLPIPPTLTIADTEENLLLPEPLLKNSMIAAKFSGNLLNIDWSASYFRGFDDIPIANSITAVPIDITSLKVSSKLSFPSLHIVGADLAGELFSIGFWAEGALFIPDKERLLISVTLPDETPQTEELTILSDELYFKYTVGLDYTLKSGVYFNIQYMHGFFHERGRNNLQDYLIARGEREFFNEMLMAALNGGINVGNFNNIQNNIGYFITPEMSFKPTDSVEVTIGTFLLYGGGNTLFGQWKDFDQAYLKVRVDF